jgi:hypothetical protein
LGGGMVLARDLHKRIQNIQIQIGASTRVAHLEKEISTLTDAVSLLVNKLEKPIQEDTKNPYEDENGNTKKIDRKAIPKDNNDEKWKEYLDDNDELDADKILAEDEEEEPDVEEEDDEEEEYEEDEEEEEERKLPDEEPELASQTWEKKHLKELSGYKEEKEKSIGGVAHEWTERDDLLADNYTVLSKRVIFYKNKNYSHLEHIEYLEIKCKNKLKYITLTNLLQLILAITNKRWKLDKPIEFSICNAKYEFNHRRRYLVDNLVDFFKKVSKLKDSRFSQ